VRPIHAGIIAAGRGQRLAGGYPGLIKPLVEVAGRPLCHWIAGSLLQAGFETLTLLHNSGGRALRESLKGAFPRARWTFLEADTASSWESFRLVSRTLSRHDEPFVISTVDAIISPADIARFADEASQKKSVAGLALTEFIDDEKPLLAELNDLGFVSKLGETCSVRKYATSGLYYLTPPAVSKMPLPSKHSKLRDYLTDLVSSGAPVSGTVLTKTIDVDRPEDVVQAEGFLKEALGTW
jgi:NDP-sugar pyrophosphorylase family protein